MREEGFARGREHEGRRRGRSGAQRGRQQRPAAPVGAAAVGTGGRPRSGRRDGAGSVVAGRGLVAGGRHSHRPWGAPAGARVPASRTLERGRAEGGEPSRSLEARGPLALGPGGASGQSGQRGRPRGRSSGCRAEGQRQCRGDRRGGGGRHGSHTAGGCRPGGGQLVPGGGPALRPEPTPHGLGGRGPSSPPHRCRQDLPTRIPGAEGRVCAESGCGPSRPWGPAPGSQERGDLPWPQRWPEPPPCPGPGSAVPRPRGGGLCVHQGALSTLQEGQVPPLPGR